MEHAVHLYSAIVGCTVGGLLVMLRVLKPNRKRTIGSVLGACAFLSGFGLIGLALEHHDALTGLRVGGAVAAGSGLVFLSWWANRVMSH